MPAPILFLETASGHEQEISQEAASQIAKQLVSTLRRARKVNAKIALNSREPLRNCKVAPNWILSAALGGIANREEWEFIKTLADRSPISSGLEEWLGVSELTEATTGECVQSQALLWASLLETGTVSFFAKSNWQHSWIDAQIKRLDDDGELLFIETRIRNASKTEHVDEHESWLRTLGYDNLPSAVDLWNEKDHHFPRLRFLSRVQKDLLYLTSSGSSYKQALETLKALNNDAQIWEATSAELQFSVKVTPEYEKRRKLCLVYDERTGAEHCFDTHARFTGGVAGRIHFRVDNANRKLVIAYIGIKLNRPI
ncbi:hypothetical protein [Nitrosomonas sp.]|uniref:hypothetical protein n=1 Tax=Nitrosomonas sp. TaxID=42353 RepID=UPI00271C481B|nr:hypothetical protein [Nitrosomonas sp.]MDO8893766.1 hypothetical protein [Nitrosomonas sp.]